MNLKKPAIAIAVVLAIAAAGAVATPTIARMVAERHVDDALDRIRWRGTAVVHRGPVAIDLMSRTVTVRDIAIQAPGEISPDLKIGALTVVRPYQTDDRMTADRVIVEDVSLVVAGDSYVAPRLTIESYAGPAQGLIATPGLGRVAHTRADALARMSLRSLDAPAITLSATGEDGERTVRDLRIENVVDGVVGKASARSAALRQPLSVRPGRPTRAIEIATGPIVAETLSLPAVWRMLDGDKAGTREGLVARASVDDVRASLQGGAVGDSSATLGRFEAEGVELRQVDYPFRSLLEANAKARRREELTPADIRQQILVATDAIGAVAFKRLSASDVALDGPLPHRRRMAGRFGRLTLGPYADGRLDLARVEMLESAGIAMGDARLEGVDVTALLAYAGRVGRDEVLMTTTPSPQDSLSLFPRVATSLIKDLAFTVDDLPVRIASVAAESSVTAAGAPARLALRVQGVDGRLPVAFSSELATLTAASLDRLTGGFGFALSLDPKARELNLETLDFAFDGLLEVMMSGGLGNVDAALLTAAGADQISRLSDVTLEPLKLTLKDKGAVGLLIGQTAAALGTTPELLRPIIAEQAAAALTDVLGPSSSPSAEALAGFIRNPATLRATIEPNDPGASLLQLIGAFQLGPKGVAQVLRLTAVRSD